MHSNSDLPGLLPLKVRQVLSDSVQLRYLPQTPQPAARRRRGRGSGGGTRGVFSWRFSFQTADSVCEQTEQRDIPLGGGWPLCHYNMPVGKRQGFWEVYFCGQKSLPFQGRWLGVSRDGEVAANLIKPLSQPAADSSPHRGSHPLRRDNPSGAARQLPLTRGALGRRCFVIMSTICCAV